MVDVKFSSRRKILLAGILLFLVLALALFSLFGHTKTFTVMPQERLQSAEEGEGLFVFYQYAPLLYSGEDMSGLDLDPNQRYPDRTPLGKLTDSLRSKGKEILDHRESLRSKGDRVQAIHFPIEGRMPLLPAAIGEEGDRENYQTPFSTQSQEGNHSYPLLGDDRPVPDLNEKARDWEEDYIESCLSSGQVLSSPYGRIILSTDGLEEWITPSILSALGPGDVRKKALGLPKRQEGLTFVEDRIFYLVVDLGQSVGERDFQPGQGVSLQIDGSIDLEGRLDRMVESKEGEALYIFSLRQGFSKISGKRYCSVKLLEDQEDAFLLPINTVASDEKGQSYCFRLDRTNSAQRVPVKILEKKGDYLYVSAKAPEDPKLPRLSAYDQVLYKPAAIQEGKNY